MGKVSFSIDKKKVREGEYITVSWDCQEPDQVSLTVEDGAKTVLHLGDRGSRVVQASGNADKITLTLRASIAGKTESRSETVKVERKVLKAEMPRKEKRTGQRRKHSGPDFTGVKNWWNRTKGMFSYSWSALPDTKKLASKLLGILMLIMLLTSFAPKLFPLGMIALVGYLTLVIIRR